MCGAGQASGFDGVGVKLFRKKKTQHETYRRKPSFYPLSPPWSSCCCLRRRRLRCLARLVIVSIRFPILFLRVNVFLFCFDFCIFLLYLVSEFLCRLALVLLKFKTILYCEIKNEKSMSMKLQFANSRALNSYHKQHNRTNNINIVIRN